MKYKPWLLGYLLVFIIPLYGQETPLITQTYLNQPLSTVLQEFSDQHQMLFAYNQDELEGIFVHARFEDAPIEHVVQSVLKDSGMEFLKVSSTEFLIRKDHSLSIPPYLINGRLIDAESKEPLNWATIYDSQTRQSTYSDENGKFTLRLITADTQGTLYIQYLGFEEMTVSWEKGQKSFYLELTPQPISLREIEVIERLPTVRHEVRGSGYKRKVSLEKVQLGSPGVNDEWSSIRFLPGISATDDLSAGLNIRGGDETTNLYLLDGIEFWNVGHFFGVFSAFEPKVIDSTSLYITDFPVEYGGRTSGVIDMSLKDPTIGEWNGLMDMHSLYSHLQLNIPITKKSALLLSTRFTNGDISDSDIFDVLFQNTEINREVSNPRQNEYILSVVPDYRFNDNQIKWLYQPTEKARLSLSVVGGMDQYVAKYNALEERKVGRFTVQLNHLFEERIKWENGGFNFSYDHDFTDTWTSSLDLTGSSQSSRQDLAAALAIIRQTGPDTIKLENNNSNLVAGGGLVWNNLLKFENGQDVCFGIGAENHRSEIRYEQAKNIFERKDTSINLNVFVSHEVPMSERTRFKYGFRSSFYQPTEKWYLSPRLGLYHNFNESWSWSASTGLYNQFLRSLTYEDALGKMHDIWLLANDTIPVLRSLHFNTNLAYTSDQFDFKLDLFTKSSTDEIRQMWVQRGFDPMTGTPKFSNLALFVGDGLSRGLDVYVAYRTKFISTSLSYTYSSTTMSVDRIDNGTPFPGNNDRRHELNALMEWYRGKWTIGAAGVYGSGLPYVSVLEVDGKDRRNLTVQESITRLSDYLRMDLSINYDFELWSDQWSVGCSIFNILDRQNTDQIQYLYDLSFLDNTSSEQNFFGSEIQLLPRTFDLHITWRLD